MLKYKAYILTVSMLLLLVPSAIALASDISNAIWLATVRVTNNSTFEDKIGIVTLFTANASALEDSGYLDTNASGVAIRSSGEDVAFAPVYNSVDWLVFVESINKGANLDYEMYSSTATGGKYAYFPGDEGMTTSDAASIEFSDNFTYEASGWLDTDAGDGKLILNKNGAYFFRVDNTTSGNISAGVADGPCLSFTTNDYLAKAAAVHAPSGNTTSIDIWFYADSLSATYRHLFALGDISVANTYWIVRKDNSNKIEAIIGNSAGSGYAVQWVSDDAITSGVWHFLTVSYDANATPELHVYLDGEEMDGTDSGDGTEIYDQNSYLAIGGAWTGAAYNYFWEGDIDETRLSNIARTEAEHIAAYESGWGGMELDGDVTDSLWHMDEGTGSPTYDEYTDNDLFVQGATWVETSPARTLPIAEISGVASGDYVLNAGISSPFQGIGIDATDFALPVNGSLVINAPLWQTECNSDPFDTIDDNAISADVSGASWAVDEGYTFSGADYIAIDDDAVLDITHDLSIEFWINTTFPAATAGVVSKADWADDFSGGYGVYMSTSGQLIWFSSNTTASENKNLSLLTSGTWNHVVIVFTDGDKVVSYINGTEGLSDTVTITPAANAFVVNLMADDNASHNRNCPGILGEVRIYDCALSSDEVSQNYNATKQKYDDGEIYTFSEVVTVPDRATDYESFLNGSMLYAEYQEITVAGVQRQYVDWEYGTTFTDSSGNSNDATPTFRTTSSDADVTASLVNFSPSTESTLSSFTLSTSYDILSGNVSVPSGMYATGNISTFIPSEPISEILSAAGMPSAAWWYPFVYFLLAVVGFTAYGLTTHGQNKLTGKIEQGVWDGSLIFMCVVIEAGLYLSARFNIIEYWPVYIFPIGALCICLSKKFYAWG